MSTHRFSISVSLKESALVALIVDWQERGEASARVREALKAYYLEGVTLTDVVALLKEQSVLIEQLQRTVSALQSGMVVVSDAVSEVDDDFLNFGSQFEM